MKRVFLMGYPIALIAAMDQNQLIGAGNQLPWRLPDDLRWFAQKTMGKPVIMAANGESSEIIRRRLFEWDGMTFRIYASDDEVRRWMPCCSSMRLRTLAVVSWLLPMRVCIWLVVSASRDCMLFSGQRARV